MPRRQPSLRPVHVKPAATMLLIFHHGLKETVVKGEAEALSEAEHAEAEGGDRATVKALTTRVKAMMMTLNSPIHASIYQPTWAASQFSLKGAGARLLG